jgi:outer membrane protein OmpA-like peptidoglycan-associated protein
MNALFVRGALLAALVIAQGCSTNPPPVPEPEQKTAVTMPVKPLVEHMVFFDFDISDAPENINPFIAPHVRYLVQHPNQKILIEGHADESGDKAYNRALGLKRAETIKAAFLKEGIDKSQLITKSQGETNPLNMQNKHERNRRVQLLY